MHPRDTLKAWLADNDIAPAEFARRVDYDRGNFHRLLNSGSVYPSLELALRIERETAGTVPISSWAKAKSGETKAAA